MNFWKTALLIFSSLLFFIIGLFIYAVKDPTVTELNSVAINDRETRVKIIIEEIKVHSDILDAEFKLHNVNGFNGQHHRFLDVPGASNSYYLFALKVKPEETENWLNHMQEVNIDSLKNSSDSASLKMENFRFTTASFQELIEHRKQNWVHYSKPRFFIRPNNSQDLLNQASMLIYEKEGIVFKSVMQD